MPNQRTAPWALLFDPMQMPGFGSRNVSLQGFMGGAEINPTYERGPYVMGDARDLRRVLNSGCVAQTLPSSMKRVK